MAAEIAMETPMNFCIGLLRSSVRTIVQARFFSSYRSVSAVVLSCLLLALQPASARTYGIVVTGLGGTDEYSEAFARSAQSYSEGLRSLESDESLIMTLEEGATRESILAAIDTQVERMQADTEELNNELSTNSVFALILTGHGNADKEGWRLNVSGPDLTSDDLVAALNGVPASKQLVVLTASASGAALDTLSQLGRVLVTATKSGGEINAVRFHAFLAEAMQSDIADYDRNEILTIAEAYRYAESRTRDYYEQQKLLASEHSRLRGELADDIAVALLGSLQDARDDPIVASLLEQRLTLEQRFKVLRERKPQMPVEDYYGELETLLLSIARLQESIDEATGWSESDADS